MAVCAFGFLGTFLLVVISSIWMRNPPTLWKPKGAVRLAVFETFTVMGMLTNFAQLSPERPYKRATLPKRRLCRTEQPFGENRVYPTYLL